MSSFHWLRAFLILLATCALVLVLSRTAFAEGGHHGQHQMPAYSDIDADGDNKVTAEEFHRFHESRMAERAAEGHQLKHAKDAPAFEDLDLDGDGSLSAEEFAAHHAQCPMHGGKRDVEPGQ